MAPPVAPATPPDDALDGDAERPRPRGLAADTGQLLIEGVRAFRGLFDVALRTVYWSLKGRREKGVVLEQAFEIGNKSVFFLTVTQGFIGMILVFQSGLQARRVVPDLTMLGATFLELLVRDLAATLASMMLATRVGAGIAAEIGSMVVTEQVDALRMCGVDPVDWLVVPRFLASVVMTGVLIFYAGAIAYFAGGATAWAVFDVQPQTYLNARLLDIGDVSIGLAKCVAYGAAIPIVSGWCGLSARGGSEGVGIATTQAVVFSSLAVIILNLVISGVGFVLFPV
ncbi:MAG: ABC transporter permease [Myxococcales bacterium]|nr:ABC transporter permease [Myxococcales bacterium]